MRMSINEIAKIVRNDRATVARRAEELRLKPEDSPGSAPNKAKLYETHDLLQLRPLPNKANDSSGAGATLEEARIRSELAKAEKTELEVEKIKGNSADVCEIMQAQNEIFDFIAGVIKRSALTDTEREEIQSEISVKVGRIWEG